MYVISIGGNVVSCPFFWMSLYTPGHIISSSVFTSLKVCVSGLLAPFYLIALCQEAAATNSTHQTWSTEVNLCAFT